jgi:hypothetical protein
LVGVVSLRSLRLPEVNSGCAPVFRQNAASVSRAFAEMPVQSTAVSAVRGFDRL